MGTSSEGEALTGHHKPGTTRSRGPILAARGVPLSPQSFRSNAAMARRHSRISVDQPSQLLYEAETRPPARAYLRH
jgi:hypothetical protein